MGGRSPATSRYLLWRSWRFSRFAFDTFPNLTARRSARNACFPSFSPIIVFIVFLSRHASLFREKLARGVRATFLKF